jgi:hypothetical protein
MTAPEPKQLNNHSKIKLPSGFDLYGVHNAGTPEIKDMVKHRVTSWATSCWEGFVEVWQITEDHKLLLVGAKTFGANEFVPVGPFEASANSSLMLSNFRNWDCPKVWIPVATITDVASWLVEVDLSLEELKQAAGKSIEKSIWNGFYPYYTLNGKVISYRSRNALTPLT